MQIMMATLEIGPLSNFFEADEIAAIDSALGEHEAAPHVDADDDAHLVEGNLDEDLLADFRDQLEANEASATVYLPSEFEDVFEAAGYQVGSSHALLAALANMRDDMGIDEDDDPDANADEDEDEEDVFDSSTDTGIGYEEDGSAIDLKDEQMRHMWRAFHKGAQASIDRGLALLVKGA